MFLNSSLASSAEAGHIYMIFYKRQNYRESKQARGGQSEGEGSDCKGTREVPQMIETIS